MKRSGTLTKSCGKRAKAHTVIRRWLPTAAQHGGQSDPLAESEVGLRASCLRAQLRALACLALPGEKSVHWAPSHCLGRLPQGASLRLRAAQGGQRLRLRQRGRAALCRPEDPGLRAVPSQALRGECVARWQAGANPSPNPSPGPSPGLSPGPNSNPSTPILTLGAPGQLRHRGAGCAVRRTVAGGAGGGGDDECEEWRDEPRLAAPWTHHLEQRGHWRRDV
eukprot:scaffold5769_cov56-Phaeocystis_antarctica.AAC.3